MTDKSFQRLRSTAISVGLLKSSEQFAVSADHKNSGLPPMITLFIRHSSGRGYLMAAPLACAYSASKTQSLK
ncbi:MAG: hypothetical protein DBW81_09085 [Synechococcus sp. MED-G67]|nr:MAG: hypothetical protein DBW81_09085 [Synechococcus sp. MED-G67]